MMMAFFFDIFRACKSANTQMFADNRIHRIPNICEIRDRGLLTNDCLRLSAESEDNDVYETRKPKMLLNISGTNP